MVSKYTPITTNGYVILQSDLIIGYNIFGVRYSGAITIYIPSFIDTRQLMFFKDENSTATITLTVAP